MRRLIDLTVRSGASAHWLRAALPTSSRPSSASPTNEGRIGSPSSSHTTGLPSTTNATSLFVVPRSMPTIGSLISALNKGGRRKDESDRLVDPSALILFAHRDAHLS